jgi:hypothetical protein
MCDGVARHGWQGCDVRNSLIPLGVFMEQLTLSRSRWSVGTVCHIVNSSIISPEDIQPRAHAAVHPLNRLRHLRHHHTAITEEFDLMVFARVPIKVSIAQRRKECMTSSFATVTVGDYVTVNPRCTPGWGRGEVILEVKFTVQRNLRSL